MKKSYVKPAVEKIVFDYKSQIVTGSGCIESVINIRVGENACGEGTPTIIGWTEPQTGV